MHGKFVGMVWANKIIYHRENQVIKIKSNVAKFNICPTLGLCLSCYYNYFSLAKVFSPYPFPGM